MFQLQTRFQQNGWAYISTCSYESYFQTCHLYFSNSRQMQHPHGSQDYEGQASCPSRNLNTPQMHICLMIQRLTVFSQQSLHKLLKDCGIAVEFLLRLHLLNIGLPVGPINSAELGLSVHVLGVAFYLFISILHVLSFGKTYFAGKNLFCWKNQVLTKYEVFFNQQNNFVYFHLKNNIFLAKQHQTVLIRLLSNLALAFCLQRSRHLKSQFNKIVNMLTVNINFSLLGVHQFIKE